MKNQESYSIAFDIGTNSVGWAVVNDQAELMKFKKRNMWGVRLFEEGKPAKGRRLARGQRRRYVRTKNRIDLLQNLMSDFVLQKDLDFFKKMDESFIHQNVSKKNPPLFFNKKECEDLNYFNYPTIYHLRNDLIKSDRKFDPRLIYLALHHIIKYRGNFLKQGEEFILSGSNLDFDLRKLVDSINENREDTEVVKCNYEKAIIILLDFKKRRINKKELLIDEFFADGKEGQKTIAEITKAILGYKFNLVNLFNNATYLDDTGKSKTIEISDENLEESIEGLLTEEDHEILLKLKEIYSFVVLMEILKGKDCISEAMIEKYSKHKKELEELKEVFKNISRFEYTNMFSNLNFDEKNKSNYALYIKNPGKNTKENLYRKIKEILEKNKECVDSKIYEKIIQEMSNNTYLDKQNTTDNSVIPYQIHQMELKKILENQIKYYPELEEVKGKILKIHEFRIPYYVGPLTKTGYNKFAWAERKEEGKIYPWNFEEKIDRHKSAEEFILRMRNNCTYLTDQEVIPKCSLLYEKFEVLNELNKIKMDRKEIPLELKQKIFDGVFQNSQTVTKSSLEKWIKINGHCKDEVEISGFQKENEFASSLKSHIKLKKIFGKIDKTNEQMLEEIIKWLTLFEDRQIVKEKINIAYPEISELTIKEILKLNFKGWSRLSKTLINGIKNKDERGESRTIIDYLYDTNMNFMQIINYKDFSFKNQIDTWGSKIKVNKVTYDEVRDLQGSPAIKKAIWQTVQITEEIVKIMGCEPSEIVLEFAKSDDASKRTTSRVDMLSKAYDAIILDNENPLSKDTNFQEVKNELKAVKERKDKIDNQRLFLYFIQNGKCMYSGQRLEISQLNMYQVDHIIPQSFIKDDSIDNLALVKTDLNQAKKDSLVLDPEIIKKQKYFWENLFKAKLISAKKLYNLKRSEYSEQDIEGFINRQIVETRQITKHVVNLLHERFPETEFVGIKASLNSGLREKLDLYKVREINDIHHAHDAYLSAAISKFLKDHLKHLRPLVVYNFNLEIDNKNVRYRYSSLFEKSNRKNNFGLVPTLFTKNIVDKETGEVKYDSQTEILKIKKYFNDKNYFITKKLEEGTGQFFNINIKNSKEGWIPIRKGPNGEFLDPHLYGGYTGVNKAYYIPVEYIDEKQNKKGEIKRTIKREVIGIPIHIASEQKSNSKKIDEYLKQSGYIDAKIIGKKILKHQLIEVQGARYYITSDSEFNNATQLMLGANFVETIAKTNSKKMKDEERIMLSPKLDLLYNEILQKYMIYYPGFNNLLEILKNYQENFILLNFEEKGKFINETLKITQANSANANWKNFEINGKQLGTDRIGRLSGKVIKLDNTIFIDQSVTGMYESNRKY